MSHDKVPTSLKPRLKVVDGEITTTSLDVAEKFGKQHKDVLKAIRNLECSEEFAKRNFALVMETMTYKNSAGELVTKETSRIGHYSITRDGFSFLAMGFTGKEAARWKESYINAFNIMGNRLVEAARSLKQFGQSSIGNPIDLSDPNNLPVMNPALFLHLFSALNHELPATIMVWWAIKHEAYRDPIQISYRAIEEEFGYIARKSGLHLATQKLSERGVLVCSSRRGAGTTIYLQMAPLSALMAQSMGQDNLTQLFNNQCLTALAADVKQIVMH